MDKVIEKIVKESKDNKVSFLLGSGISINSGIPMVGGVKDNEIYDGIETYILSKLGFSIDEISSFIDQIPFETFFEVLIDNGLDMKTFTKVFESKPSHIHKTIARLAQKGLINSIATTNFDECIEKALDALNVSYDIRISNRIIKRENEELVVRKFHGSIDDVQNLVISVKKITNRTGYDGRKSDVDEFLMDSDSIIVSGYSCSDIFDLTPFFQSFNLSEGKKIIYVSHSNDHCCEIVEDKNNPDFHKIYNMFKNYDLTIVRCNTDSFFDALITGYSMIPEKIEKFKTPWKQIIDDCLNGFSLFQNYKTCGNLYFKINENQKSIDYLYKAHDISENESERIACLRSIAWTYIYEKRYKEALKILEPFSNSSQERINEHFVHYANIYSCLGVCYTILKPTEAERYYKRALALCEEYQLKREEGYVLINFAELYDEFYKNSVEAIELTKKALLLMQEEGYIDTVGVCHSNLAMYHYLQGNFKEAQNNIQIALEIASKLGDANLNNRKLIQIAIDIRQFINQKLDYVKAFQEILYKGFSNTDKANCNHLVGELYHMLGQTEEAVKYWKNAKKQYDDLNMKSLFGEVNEKRLEEHSGK